MFNVMSGRNRACLLASTALFAFPALAHAQSTTAAGISNAYLESQNSSASVTTTTDIGAPTAAYLEPQNNNVIKIDPEPEILIANPGTPTTARDPVNITGIAQMIVDQGGGFVGLCTGTLINPRTVLFAAHCVNSAAATSYGAGSGGTAIGFGFETNTRANAAGQTDELVRWLLGGTGGAGKYQTNLAQAFFNVNQVRYNTLSLEAAANKFLYGDVAVASLDTPAAGIPTWALLFSPLTNTSTITAAGTGFNVGIVGYGNNGTGQSGAAGSDFRRRAAENILGAYTDLQTFEGFLFGGAPNGLTQNLYFLDFDDPRRGTPQASAFDFNAFRDNARAGANGGASLEGITSQGDSGGPLILQNFSKQLVIGVLSGGYTRFFGGQPANSYGTVSFYQPLNLYWDWIAANNPYHYVTANAGDASWADATHWVTTLDPAYYVLGSNGQPVNGIPTSPGEQKNGTTGDFGQICFQSGGVSDCYDTRTGVETVDARPIGTAENQPANADVTASAGAATRVAREGSELEAQDASTLALPAATLASGLPGATNFVPNNVDPVRTTGAIGQYYDVTLTNAGKTTLSGASVTIDRLTLGGNSATLAVANTGALTSLININHFAGTLAVDGTVTSVGDYSFFGGLLSGSGRVNAPFLTSVTGQFAPGTLTSVGTLTVGGNLVMSSGTTTFINLGPNQTADKLAVTGTANVGGFVSFSPVSGHTVRAGDIYTILTSQGARTGTFSTSALSAILTPQFLYSANDVRIQIAAGAYGSVVANTPVQRAYAALLDRDRTNNTGTLSDLYGWLDLQSASTIQSTLESWAPRNQTLATSIGKVVTDNMDRFYRARLTNLTVGSGDYDGSMAVTGNPLQRVAMASQYPVSHLGASDDSTTVEEGRLPEGTRGYFAGGYLDGHGRSMLTAIPYGGRDNFDGWYVTGGIETQMGDNGALGFGLSYSKVSGTTGGLPQTAKGELIQGSVYGKYQTSGGLTLDFHTSAGQFSAKTERVAALGSTVYTLRSKDNTLALTSEIGVGQMFGDAVQFGPRVAVRASNVGFTPTVERGGPMALAFDHGKHTSVQGLAGLSLGGSTKGFRPYASAYLVHEFRDQADSFGANFVGATGLPAAFAYGSTDKNWGEASIGIAFGSKNMEFSLGADTTFMRKDVSNQAYRGSVTFRF